MRRRLLARFASAALLAGALFGIARAARAETPPNSWDIVRDPSLRERWATHVYVQRQLFSAGSEEPLDRNRMRSFALDAALRSLRAANAATSDDVRLRFDLMQVLRERDNLLLEKHDAELLPLAQSVCGDERATDHQRSSACFVVALVHAKAERTEEEIAAYADVLRFESDPLQRGITVMNRAEGYMRLGRLTEAIEGYREVIVMLSPLSQRGDTITSAYWGLAVALDRYRDTQGALAAASWAVSSDPGLFLVSPGHRPGENPDVFFVPDYDAHWYRAIGWRAKAMSPGVPARDVARYLGQSAMEYALYVASAERAKDQGYLAVGKERLDAVKKLYAAAQKKVPPVPPDDFSF